MAQETLFDVVADALQSSAGLDSLATRGTLRLALTPWCHVDLDADELRKMEEHIPEILGTALTQALQEERLKKGE